MIALRRRYTIIVLCLLAPLAASTWLSGAWGLPGRLQSTSSASAAAEAPVEHGATMQTAREMWRPPLATAWQWQLEPRGELDQSVDVPIYDIDLFYHDASVVQSLHAKGRKVTCYVSVGSWEDWRPDAASFPDIVKGRRNGWRGEVWLDIRRLDILAPIMEARLDMCRAKGFDAVEPDNVDAHIHNSGFPITADDQLRYNRFIADAAHARGLSVGLKNDLPQVPDLLPHFDWALNEQCFEDDECELLLPFIRAGKAVFQVEYELDTDEFCSQANAMNFNSMKKNLGLDAYREPCR
jgi:hypothetical protein